MFTIYISRYPYANVIVMVQSLRVGETLQLYQGADCAPEGSWMNFGITKASEQINGRLAMLALAVLAVNTVLKVGCPSIEGPSVSSIKAY
jgi:hypothetical protein